MRIIFLLSLFIFGCAVKNLEPTTTFHIGMTEEDFMRKNPDIEKTNELGEFSTYIGNSGKYIYIVGREIPRFRYEEYTFAFKNDTLEAVYRGRNNFSPNRELEYSKYSK